MKNASLSRKTNRTSNPDSLSQNRRPPRSRWIFSFAGLVILAIGFGVWTLAQPVPQPDPNQDPIKARLGEPDESPEKRAERELSRLAILEPAAFAAEMDKHKTPQERLNEQIAVFGISQPKAYAAEFEKFKDAERRQKEQQARAAVLDPVRHSGSADQLNADVRQKKKRGEPVDEILAPKFISGNTPTQSAVNPAKEIVRPAKPASR